MFRLYDKFKDLPVEDEKLKVLEEATLYAPYGLNPPQPWNVVVVKTPENVKKLSSLHKVNAPVIFLFFIRRGIMQPNHLTNLVSGVAQAVNLAIQCESMGLGCFIDINPSRDFYNEAFKLSGLPNTTWELSAAAFVGYPERELRKQEVNVEFVERG
ncbi:MAG: hypothetical protein ABIL16_08450 [candidate division WOR-3 bacterium]